MNALQKDWVKHIVVIGGILIGIWIIIGFIYQVRYFLNLKSAQEKISLCEKCITQADNNYQQTILISSVITLELPSAVYSQKNLVILQDPSGSFKRLKSVAPTKKGNWALQFQAVQEGYIDIVIKSNNETISDYHTVIIIE